MENERRVTLRLYITGHTGRSQRAITNLRRVCESKIDGDYKVVVVDVLEHPEAAEEAKILATPTLIKELPLPVRRIIGDLTDVEKVLIALEII